MIPVLSWRYWWSVIASMFKTFLDAVGGKAAATGYITGLVAMLSFVIQFATLEKSKDDQAFALIVEDNKFLREQNMDFRNTISSLRHELADRDATLNVLSAARGDEPIIAWAKDRQGRYIEFNRAFERQILLPHDLEREEVLFHTDMEIWPDSTLARQYRNNDLEVMRRRQSMKFREFMRFDRDVVSYVSEKYPLTVMNRVVGTAGQAYEDCD